MKLDNYAIQQLAPYMTGHKDHGANFTGRELVDFGGVPIMSSGSFVIVFKMKEELDENFYAIKYFMKKPEKLNKGTFRNE